MIQEAHAGLKKEPEEPPACPGVHPIFRLHVRVQTKDPPVRLGEMVMDGRRFFGGLSHRWLGLGIGVASGHSLPDSVVLRTRLAPDPLNVDEDDQALRRGSFTDKQAHADPAP